MILILGATGKVGGTAASELRQRGRAVRALVRSAAKAARLEQLGCELFEADLRDRGGLARAAEGVDAMLAVCPLRADADDVLADAKETIESIGAAVDAARVPRVVAISDYGAEHPSGTGVTLILHALEERLRATRASSTTLLRSAEHMQNWLRQAKVARATGVLPSLHHPVTRPFPTVSAYDVGAVAAALLAEPEPALGTSVVHVEGPRRYAAEDFARAFEGAFGRAVVANAVERARWADTLAAAKVPAGYARLVMELQDAHNAGRIDVEAGVGEVRRGTTTLSDALGAALAPG